MGLNINRPAPIDVTKANPRSKLYVTTDNTALIGSDTDPDGSIRIVFTPGENEAHIELKASGVYNDTGFRFSSSSLSVGRDMIVSAIAGFLETINPSAITGHTRSFIPHIQFNNEFTEFIHAPIVKTSETFVVFSTAVSEISGTTIGINLGVVPSRIVENSIHEVGTVPATQSVTVKFFKGTDNTGILFNQRVLPASDLPANTTLSIDYDQDLGFEAGQNIFQEFTSTASFSLKTDSGGNPLTSHAGHETSEVGVISENLVFDNALDHVLDISLNPVYHNQSQPIAATS